MFRYLFIVFLLLLLYVSIFWPDAQKGIGLSVFNKIQEIKLTFSYICLLMEQEKT